MKDFKDLVLGQKELHCFKNVVSDVDAFPHKEAARIIENQILRSAASITANIAEGFGSKRGREFAHYPFPLYCSWIDQ